MPDARCCSVCWHLPLKALRLEWQLEGHGASSFPVRSVLGSDGLKMSVSSLYDLEKPLGARAPSAHLSCGLHGPLSASLSSSQGGAAANPLIFYLC